MKCTIFFALLFAVILAFTVSCASNGGEVSEADLSPGDAEDVAYSIMATDNPGTLNFSQRIPSSANLCRQRTAGTCCTRYGMISMRIGLRMGITQGETMFTLT